jgi:hypothetical protein
MKQLSQNSTKTMLGNRCQKIKTTYSKSDPKSVQEIRGFQGWCLMWRLWSPKPFLATKSWSPSAHEVLPMIEKSTNEDTNEHPQLRNIIPKINAFRNLARRTARSTYNKELWNMYRNQPSMHRYH